MNYSSTKALPSIAITSTKGLELHDLQYPRLPETFKLDSISARSASFSWQPSPSNPELLIYYMKMNGNSDSLFGEDVDDNVEAPLQLERGIIYQISKSKKDSLLYQPFYNGNEMTCFDACLIPVLSTRVSHSRSKCTNSS